MGVLLLCLSCGDDAAPCVDLDADGFGEGCAAGLDCDDDNAARTDDCDIVPPPDCAADPLATGCPCLPGGVSPCYPADEATLGVGPCRAGRVTCINAHWGLCDGAVVPAFEICDGVDQDCDGLADDGVLSPCGGCTAGCAGGVWGEGELPFEPGGGTALTDRGELTLAREALVVDAVWVANAADATLSRIDPEAAVEVARYATGGREPSRVAVDYRGDAWVANREFDGVSTVTRVAASTDRCVDRDGDGDIRTSTGPDDVLPPGEDECVVLTAPVGELGGVARALAIDGDLGLDGAGGGHPWVGMHEGMEVLRLDGETGEILDRLPTPGFAPYAAAFDPWGVLWMISRDGQLARIDRGRRPLQAEIVEVPLECYVLYGLAIDATGRLLLTGFSCDQVVLHEPWAGTFRPLVTPPSVRGAAPAPDGRFWVAHTDGRVSAITAAPLSLATTVDLVTEGFVPRESIGVGVDAAGGVWVASTHGGESGDGLATRVDPAAQEVTAQITVGRAPHTQGDLTGGKRLGGFVPEGERTQVFTGCGAGEPTEWSRVHLAADPGTAGRVEVAVRSAPDSTSLGSARFEVVGALPDDEPPYALSLPDGGVVEVRLTLRTRARDGAPRVRRVGLEWRCPGPD